MEEVKKSVSNMSNGKIVKFTDLVAWQEGHKLVLMTYESTRSFPKDEMFALVSQMRRCVVSVTSNIAEGFSRNSVKERVQFYSIALGSVTELQNQLLIARDVKYISAKEFKVTAEQSVVVHKILNGLLKKTKEFSRS